MTMNKFTTFAVMALLASSNAFAPSGPSTPVNVYTSEVASPYYIDVHAVQQATASVTDSIGESAVTTHTPVEKKIQSPKKVAPKKGGGAVHKEGIFSPAVLAAKAVMGDEQLNKVRAKAISLHSDVIASFVDTHETPTGQAALKTLFAIADKDGNGTICEKELNDALQALGFTWLQEKQVQGIFKRGLSPLRL
jgi:hypothetical protein